MGVRRDVRRTGRGWRPFTALALACALLLATVSVAAARPAAGAATTVTITLSRSVSIAGEQLNVQGVVSPASVGRALWLQRVTGATWSTVGTARTDAAGRYRFDTRAPGSSGVTSWRVLARPAGSQAQAASPSKTLRVVPQSVSVISASVVETGSAFALAGTASPARPGRSMLAQVRSASGWTTLARGTQITDGRYSIRVVLNRPATYSFRVVAAASAGGASAASRTNTIVARLPYVSVSPATAIAGEYTHWSGTVPGHAARPVQLQRRATTSTRWVVVAFTP